MCLLQLLSADIFVVMGLYFTQYIFCHLQLLKYIVEIVNYLQQCFLYSAKVEVENTEAFIIVGLCFLCVPCDKTIDGWSLFGCVVHESRI